METGLPNHYYGAFAAYRTARSLVGEAAADSELWLSRIASLEAIGRCGISDGQAAEYLNEVESLRRELAERCKHFERQIAELPAAITSDIRFSDFQNSAALLRGRIERAAMTFRKLVQTQ